jgi:hypothetical protein
MSLSHRGKASKERWYPKKYNPEFANEVDQNSYLEGGDPAGSATMLSSIEQASAKCPSTELVIAGYRYFTILI